MKLPAQIETKKVLLVLWIVFSIVYIAYDAYATVRYGLMQNAYQAGKADTINALISQANNKECQPFNVYSGENKADLINVSCLKQAGDQKSAGPATTPEKK